MALETVEELRTSTTATCAHGRLIEDLVGRQGEVRCVECGAIIEDPHCHKKYEQ